MLCQLVIFFDKVYIKFSENICRDIRDNAVCISLTFALSTISKCLFLIVLVLVNTDVVHNNNDNEIVVVVVDL